MFEKNIPCVDLKMTKEKLESVKRHRNWQDSLDKEKFFDDVFPSV